MPELVFTDGSGKRAVVSKDEIDRLMFSLEEIAWTTVRGDVQHIARYVPTEKGDAIRSIYENLEYRSFRAAIVGESVTEFMIPNTRNIVPIATLVANTICGVGSPLLKLLCLLTNIDACPIQVRPDSRSLLSELITRGLYECLLDGEAGWSGVKNLIRDASAAQTISIALEGGDRLCSFALARFQKGTMETSPPPAFGRSLLEQSRYYANGCKLSLPMFQQLARENQRAV